MNEEAKNLFKPGLMISFRSAWKLSSCLVRENFILLNEL